LSASTAYSYTVSAYDGAGNNSAQSTAKSATTNSAASTVTPPPPGTTYTTAQVATHNIQSDCWIIISGKVYNVTSFMASHPGGVTAIRTRCGTDSTTVFTTSAGHVHSSYAYSLLPTYYVGDVSSGSTGGTTTGGTTTGGLQLAEQPLRAELLQQEFL
jgi:cytochrome b involved in lipid metabolism